MPWDGSANASFTVGQPWLPLGEDQSIKNVEAQKRDPSSMLALTRTLLDLRRREPAFSGGEWAPLTVEGDVLAYIRRRDSRRFAVVLNLEPVPRAVCFGDDLRGRTILSTQPDHAGYAIGERTELGADEAVIIALEYAPSGAGPHAQA